MIIIIRKFSYCLSLIVYACYFLCPQWMAWMLFGAILYGLT